MEEVKELSALAAIVYGNWDSESLETGKTERVRLRVHIDIENEILSSKELDYSRIWIIELYQILL